MSNLATLNILRALICVTVLILAPVLYAAEAILAADTGRIAAENVAFTPKDNTWKTLSLREKIGQTMIITALSPSQITEFGSIEALIKKYPVGGVFIPSWVFVKHQPAEDVIPNIRRSIREYENAAKLPMLITEDFEHGLGAIYQGFTNFPPEMSLGAANNPALAHDFGFAIAAEAKALGVNWLLHPVADLNMNPLQELILDRSLGDDPVRAYPLLKSQLAGMRKAGVIATVKHFPGDGATMKNQHLVTSTNNLTMADWNASFGNLFQRLINDGAPSIMVSHIRLPAYQTQKIKGVLPPATLSEELMVKLLKGEMKFNGVVMSDATNMGGFQGYYDDSLEACIASFKAGVDIVLWPDLHYMDALEKRIASGEIPLSRLDDAVQRVWGVREKYGLLKKPKILYTTLTPKLSYTNAAVAKRLAEKAVTLVEDRNQELPLRTSAAKKIAIISLSFAAIPAQFEATRTDLIARGFDVAPIIYNPLSYLWQSKIIEFKKYDKVIVAFGNRNSSPMGTSLLKGDEAMGLWTANLIPFEKLIAISYGNPYYVNYYLENAPIKINAYGADPFSQAAVVSALTGVIPFVGSTPVKLNALTLQ